MIVNFLICNSNSKVAEYGHLLISLFLPLDFGELVNVDSNLSFLSKDGEGRRRKTVRKSNYINLHGDGFDEESQALIKTTLDVIEEQLQRLNMDYSESKGAIWTAENTIKVKEILESIHFENAIEEPSILDSVQEKAFKNNLSEQEIQADGIILRLYNQKPTLKLSVSNEQFLLSLFTKLKESFNKYIIYEVYKQNNYTSHEKEEEKLELDDTLYHNHLSIPASKFDILKDMDHEEIDKNLKLAGYEVTVILTSILININLNMSATNNEKDSKSSPYNLETLEEVLKREIGEYGSTEYIGIYNLLKSSSCSIIRCTVLQILAMSPKHVKMNHICNHLSTLNQNKEHSPVEALICLSVILKATLEGDQTLDQLQESDLETLCSFGTANNQNLRVFELILNRMKKQGCFGVKINQLRNSETLIDWQVVDDAVQSSLSDQPSFGASTFARITKFKKTWQAKTSFNNDLEATFKRSSHEADLEEGEYSNEIFNFSYPLLTQKALEKPCDQV